MEDNLFEREFLKLKGKTVALVYVYEGETTEGFAHYDVWQSDVISEWLVAVQELNCLPFIIDVRTFIQKAMNNTLPIIDYVINLNAGTKHLSTLGLVPSVCGVLSIPCIPCNTSSIITGENKLISNLVAQALHLNVPETLAEQSPEGIFRPLNFGSSRGIQRGYLEDEPAKEGIYQKFIKGYDVTTPILFNPLSGNLELLPSVMYCPLDRSVDWFFNEEVKEKRGGYEKRIVHLDEEAGHLFLSLAKALGINAYCRIDFRVACDDLNEFEALLQQPLPCNRLYFLELNPMPTIKNRINFHNALEHLSAQYPLSESFAQYKDFSTSATYNGFILACSMLAVSTSKR